jgi:hypothetical protein
MTDSISMLKTIGVASVTATMFMGTMAVGGERIPFNLSKTTISPEAAAEMVADGLSIPLAPATVCIIMPKYNFLGVDDQGLNNSRFFKMNLTVPQNDPKFLETFGELHKGYDIEALDSTDPMKNPPNDDGSLWSCLYLASGDNDGGNLDCDTGCLYYLNKGDAKLSLFGDICTKDKDLLEVDALAFRVGDVGWEEIWGWSQPDGLFKIKSPFPVEGSSLCGDNREAVEAEMVCEMPNLAVEDMTWVEKEGVFYVANARTIYKLNPKTCDYQTVCENKSEVREVEALEYISISEEVKLLVMGFHKAKSPTNSIVALDINDPIDDNGNCKLFPSTFSPRADVEGLAYP